MIPVLSTFELRRLDDEAVDSVSLLMERAGWGVAEAAVDLGAGYGTKVSVLAGPGNNGGDGWVAAAVLARRGVQVTVHEMAEPKTSAARDARSAALRSGALLGSPNTPIPADIVIDALFGSGVRGDLPEWLELWNDAPVVVAAHVPSGLDPDSGTASEATLGATVTVAFHALSPGHLLEDGPAVCGRLRVIDIGLEGGDPMFEVVTDSDAVLPCRRRTGHKWSVGSVLVVGGSPGMIGAPVMAAKSALAFGAGAVGLAVPDELMASAALLAPEILSYKQGDLPGRFDVILVGPGMSRANGTLDRVLSHPGPAVFDADALSPAVIERVRDRTEPTILTPHAGELERLTGKEPSWQVAAELANSVGCIVVFKGNPTFVCGPSETRVITSNGPELATIGTGDVLAGMTSAAIARGMDPIDGASAAAYWHGIAGADLASETTVTADVLAGFVGRYAGTIR